jgi:hypothetical protein
MIGTAWCQPLVGPSCAFHATPGRRERVIADGSIAPSPKISLRGAGLPVLTHIAQDIPVQLVPAVIESFSAVIGAELLFRSGIKESELFQKTLQAEHGRGRVSSGPGRLCIARR